MKDKNLLIQAKKFIISFKNKISSKISNVFANFKKFMSRDTVKSAIEFFYFIAIYGFMINFALVILLKLKFSFFNIIAWGIVYYFIREELVRILRRIIYK